MAWHFERRRRPFRPFDFEIRVSGAMGGEPFSFRITPEGIETGGFGLRRARPIEEAIAEREPLVDIVERDAELVVVAEIPGVERDQIKVDAMEDSVTIKAESPERRYYKEVALPSKVDPDTAKASYKNGVLEITLSKREGRKGKSISIE